MADYALMMELARRQMAKEMPSESKGTTVEQGGTQSPTSIMETHPGAVIKWNPQNLRQIPGLDQEQVNDLFGHELIHVRQGRQGQLDQSPMSLLKDVLLRRKIPYGQNPLELEAFQFQKDRVASQNRPPYRMMPSFTGSPVNHYDIDLDYEDVKR